MMNVGETGAITQPMINGDNSNVNTARRESLKLESSIYATATNLELRSDKSLLVKSRNPSYITVTIVINTAN